MSTIEKIQKEVCVSSGSSFVASDSDLKLGIAIDTLGSQPLNALRHPAEGSTCGWYIWGGEEVPDDPDFFKPLHVTHIKDCCPEIEKYLGLAPGWRVLLAGDQEEVWFDEGLLSLDS